MNFPFEQDFWGKKNPLYGKHAKNMMKTDIREHDAGYEVDIDLPGFKKDEISIELENGYLTVSAAKGLDKDEEDKKGKYIRKERYAGAMQRSFYVGENLTQEDIKAKYENGILRLSVPKKEAKQLRQRKQSQLKDDLNTDVSQVSNVEGAYVSPFFLCVNLFIRV